MVLPADGSASGPGPARWSPSSRIHAVAGAGAACLSCGAILLTASAPTVPGDLHRVGTADGLAALGLGLGEVGQDVGQAGVRVQDGRDVVDIGGGAEVLHVAALGDGAVQVAVGDDEPPTSVSFWPRKMMSASPWAATAGALVRSPLRLAMGSSLISPPTVSSRCTLCWLRVVSADSVISVAASGSGASLVFDPQPTSAAAAIRMAKKGEGSGLHGGASA